MTRILLTARDPQDFTDIAIVVAGAALSHKSYLTECFQRRPALCYFGRCGGRVTSCTMGITTVLVFEPHFSRSYTVSTKRVGLLLVCLPLL